MPTSRDMYEVVRRKFPRMLLAEKTVEQNSPAVKPEAAGDVESQVALKINCLDCFGWSESLEIESESPSGP
jgi:hypothetical protein